MPSTLTRNGQIARNGATQYNEPPAGFLTGTAITSADLVTLDASGRVTQAVAVGTTIANATLIASANLSTAASVATGTPVGIEKFTEDCYVTLPIADSTAGTVGVPGAATGLNATIGIPYGISRSTAGIYYLDKGVTTTVSTKAVPIAFDPASALDTFPFMVCKVIPAARLA
jgi:hypothetical protein